MAINKQLVRKHFNRHAGEYDRYAEVQRVMADRLAEQLFHLVVPSSGARVLEIGCGTGFLTKHLVKQFSPIHITAVDIAEAMLAEVQRSLGEPVKSMAWVSGDIEELLISGSLPGGDARLSDKEASGAPRYDVIVSNAAFQWFTHTEKTIARLTDCLNPSGVLAFTTFTSGTFRELHTSFMQAEQTLGLPPGEHGPGLWSAEQWRQCFAPLRGQLKWKQESCPLHYPTVSQFLHSVKRVGAGNAGTSEAAQAPSFAGKQVFREMQRRYEQHYTDSKGIRATYEVGYGLFQKTKA